MAWEDIQLAHKARVAWYDYLQVDRTTPWAEEARRRYRQLNGMPEELLWHRARIRLVRAAVNGDKLELTRLVRRFALRARRYATEDLLAEWAENAQAGRPNAARDAKRVAAAIGETHFELTGDHYLLDLVQHIESTELDEGPKVAALAEGYIAYRLGVREFDASGMKALPTLLKAEAAFSRSSSPAVYSALLFIVACEFQSAEYTSAESRLATIESAITKRSYPHLVSRVFWLRGLLAVIRGNYDRGLFAYRKAISNAIQTLEPEHAAVLYELIAEYFYWVGDSEQCWRFLRHSFRMVNRIPEPRRRELIYAGGAAAALAAGAPRIALSFQEQALQIARLSGQPAAIASALWWQARAQEQSGMKHLARRDLIEAERHAATIADLEARQVALCEVWLALADHFSEVQPRLALRYFDRAIELLRRTSYAGFLVQAYEGRARILSALGHTAQAERDLNAAITEVESLRRNVAYAHRVSFLDQAESVYRTMCSLQCKLGNYDLAFSYFDQSQGRLLSDYLVTGALEDAIDLLSIREVQEKLAKDVMLLESRATQEGIATWAITSSGWHFRQAPVSSEKVQLLIGKFRAALMQGDDGASAPLARELFHVMFSGLDHLLASRRTLVLVLGPGLEGLPTAALVDPRLGRFLVETHTIIVAPSARIALSASRCQSKPTALRLLWVERPRVDPLVSASLSPLSADRDVFPLLKSLFGHTRVLSGRNATAREFLAQAGRHDIVYLGAHAIVSFRDHRTSRILLAPSGAGDHLGILVPSQIAGAKLERTCTVFLAGCNTAAGPRSVTEGVMSLGHPFMAAGASSVIATLWKIEDHAAAAVALDFFVGVKNGLGPASALRGAQLRLLNGMEPKFKSPGVWAGFQMIGTQP
ncbi:MAG TPA: CHAT domain-containing protein [Thermoanaerobaculia bacterium]|nr:CHAT domain-containing protein [Thermoanaerobaculia bacterium]